MSKNTDLSSLINYVKGATSGRLTFPSYTSSSSFTGTIAGYLGFDSSGNILTTGGASQWITSGSDIYYNTGNVGIGTSTPDFISSGDRVFTIQGSSTRATINLQNSSTGTGGVAGSFRGYNGSTFLTTIDMIADGATNKGAFVFYTNNAGSIGERMRITSTGNVGIGTSSPDHPLTIASTSLNFAVKLLGSSATNRSLIMFYPNNGLGAGYATIGADANSFYISANNTSFLDLGGFGGGGIRIISSNGRVLIGSTVDQGAYLLQVNSQIWATNSTIATSDLRLKENVSDLDSSLNLLMAIKSRTFSYKQNTEYNFTEKGITTGFIAQELKEVLKDTPYANSIVVETGKYYGVAYDKIIPLLVKGIQELKYELDILKGKNQ